MKHGEIKDLVMELNHLELEGIEPIRVVAVKGTTLVEKFLATVDKVDDAGLTEKLPENIVTAYNTLVEETEAGGTGIDEEEKKEKKEKPAKEKKEKKEKGPGRGSQPSKPRSRYDHIQSAISGQLDDLLYEGNTVAHMMDKLNIKRPRVMSHVKHLKNDCGLTVTETKPEDKDAKLNDTHIQVKEEVYSSKR